jgi:hypothetical protein
LSEQERKREEDRDDKDDVVAEAGFCGLEAAGCCLFNAFACFALLLSGSALLLNR